MSCAGFPVPPVFGLTTTAFHAFLAAANTADLFAELTASRLAIWNARGRWGRRCASSWEAPVPPDVAERAFNRLACRRGAARLRRALQRHRRRPA
ncbi:hypothetical protein [Candidatus Amarobacter glycogenicus]|uniref:hypothetical protein n=1 Tax=Candidatus Amarobacter glycogenicus TaxID=3140699 RepID=UPI0031CCA70D